MAQPLISIVIPCYNHGQYIREAVGSVEACCNSIPFEIIVVNDGSTDTLTASVMNQLEQEGYRVINQGNKGLGAARNIGIKVANGRYILPLDSDNKVKEGFIDKAVKVLNANPSVSVVYSDVEYFGEKTNVQSIPSFNIIELFATNYIDACAVFRKSLWEEIGGYDTEMPYQGWEDWDFWLSACRQQHSFYHIAEPLYCYRVRNDSMLRSASLEKELQVRRYLYAKHQSLLQSVYVEVLVELSRKNYQLAMEVELSKRQVERLKVNRQELVKSINYQLGSMLLKPIKIIRDRFDKDKI